ncbi:MAG: membrane protein [Hyphococcus sp.]|nr:MAG: membrane protein [Marinicaulis sp.]
MRFLLFVIFLLASTATGAHAKYSFCNKTSYALSAAVGYVEGDRLATRGWWRLRPGQCKVVLTEQTNPGRYFVYAEAIPGHKGELRTWSGDTSLCVENFGFFNLRNQEVCRGDPLRQRKFFDVDVTTDAEGNWQTDFSEAGNYTIYSAEVAGVQRLLKDIGKKIGRVDGAMGRETQRALNAFRKEKNLTESTKIDDEVVDALIEEANALEAKLGFFYCNKTDNDVWSAIAQPEGEKNYTSKGWWKLAPGECSKILKGELQHDHYYIYGVIEEAMNERQITNGQKSFCVNAVMFSVDDKTECSVQELDEASFRRVEIGGAASATFDFLPEMFTAPAQ